MLLFGLFGFLISVVFPIVLIAGIIRFFTRRTSISKKDIKSLTFHDILLTLGVVLAGYSGLMSIYFLPLVLFSVENVDSNKSVGVFVSRLLFSVILLIVGLIVRGVSGNFLMSLGILGFILVAPFLLSNLGSYFGFIIVTVLLFILIGFAYHQGKKDKGVSL